MSYDNMIPHHPLLKAIFAQMEREGFGVVDLCNTIGFSRTYFVSLVNGNKDPAGLGAHYLRNIATFLGKPFPEVAIMAGFLEPEDMLELPDNQDMDHMLDQAYGVLSTDPKVCHYITVSIEEWRGLPKQIRALLVDLYLEQAHKHFADRSYEQLFAAKKAVSTAKTGKKSA